MGPARLPGPFSSLTPDTACLDLAPRPFIPHGPPHLLRRTEACLPCDALRPCFPQQLLPTFHVIPAQKPFSGVTPSPGQTGALSPGLIALGPPSTSYPDQAVRGQPRSSEALGEKRELGRCLHPFSGQAPARCFPDATPPQGPGCVRSLTSLWSR